MCSCGTDRDHDRVLIPLAIEKCDEIGCCCYCKYEGYCPKHPEIITENSCNLNVDVLQFVSV